MCGTGVDCADTGKSPKQNSEPSARERRGDPGDFIAILLAVRIEGKNDRRHYSVSNSG
jgi:hypothetical protein